MVAEVIINTIAKELNKTYDYIIPEAILKDIKIGSRVFVPFGKTKQEEGFVIGMARRYFCNVSDCIRLMLPPGNSTKNIQNRVKDKKANFVYLKKEIEEIEFDIEEGIIKSEKQKRLLTFLFENEGIHILDLEILTDTSRSIIKTLEKNGYIEILEEKVERNPFAHKNITRDKSLKLTEEQQIAYNKISSSKYKEFLIYGVTGSRKNRNIFAINRECNKTKQNSNSISSRNIFNTTNGR